MNGPCHRIRMQILSEIAEGGTRFLDNVIAAQVEGVQVAVDEG